MRFSEHMGFREVKSVIQIDSIDEDLLNGLWNAVDEIYFSHYLDGFNSGANFTTLKELTKQIWKDYFKEPIDSINLDSQRPVIEIRDYFFTTE